MVKFKDFSRPLSVFQVLFKANLIFKDFSKQSCIFKYFSSLPKPCVVIWGGGRGWAGCFGLVKQCLVSFLGVLFWVGGKDGCFTAIDFLLCCGCWYSASPPYGTIG